MNDNDTYSPLLTRLMTLCSLFSPFPASNHLEDHFFPWFSVFYAVFSYGLLFNQLISGPYGSCENLWIIHIFLSLFSCYDILILFADPLISSVHPLNPSTSLFQELPCFINQSIGKRENYIIFIQIYSTVMIHQTWNCNMFKYFHLYEHGHWILIL